MTDRTDDKKDTRSPYVRALAENVPECVQMEITKYRASRIPGRERLVDELQREWSERLNAYDEQTDCYVSTLLQVWEMSLQSKPFIREQLRKRRKERKR